MKIKKNNEKEEQGNAELKRDYETSNETIAKEKEVQENG